MKCAIVLAKAVLQAEDGTVLLLRRSESDVRRPLQWDFAGGNVEDDEDFVTACAREVEEEAGIHMAPKDLHLAYTTSIVNDNGGSVCWLFFVGHASTKEVKLSFEHDQYQWVALDEAIEMIEYDRQKIALQHIKAAKILS